MKSIKYLLLSFLVAGAFAACTKDGNYEPAAPESGDGIYFPSTFSTTVNVTDDATSFDIPVFRNVAGEELTVALIVGEQDMFTVPSSVTFAEGATSTAITVGYDPETMEYDEPYPLEITLDDPANTTIYGASNVSFSVVKAAPWISLGMATFYEGFLFYDPYEVELQQNALNPTTFRLVHPYTEGLQNPEEGYPYDGKESEYLTFYIMQPGSKLNSTVITETGLVYFDEACLFKHPTYGDYVWCYHPSIFTSFQTEESWSHNTVLSWQDEDETLPAVVQLAPYYYIDGVGGWNYTTYDGVVLIVFPGVELSDYSVEIDLKGYMQDLKNRAYAVVDITLGDDVEYAVAVSAEGDDYESILYALLDEEIEGTKITASGKYELPIVNGTNTIVVVTYAEDEAQEFDYITFNYSAGEVPELNPLEEDWTFDDLYGIEKEDLLKKWIMWGVDYWDEDGNTDRQPLNYVSFSDAEDYYDETEGVERDVDAINVSGLTLGLLEDDTQTWEYYSGYIFQLNGGVPFEETWYDEEYDDNYYVSLYIYEANNFKFYGGDRLMIGGLVADGYMAMCSGYSNYDFAGIYVNITNVEDEEDAWSMGFYYDIMFEDPAVSTLSTSFKAHKPVTTVKELHTMASQMATPKNFVELRGRERVHALIDEMNANKKTAKKDASIEILSRKNIRFSKELKQSAQPVAKL